MGALVFWAVVAFAFVILVSATVIARRGRARRIEAYSASGELRGMNIGGHERSNSAVAFGASVALKQQFPHG